MAAIPRSVIDTSLGRVEYAQDGSGPCVLIVHGVLGGCDFGVGLGRASIPPGYRIISPSRFGYLGSPMPADPSPPRQADAFAAFWAIRLLARQRLQHLSGVPGNFTPDEREQNALDAVIDSLFPIGPRARGTIYDTYTGNPEIASYPLERIAAPTLVIAAQDDTLAPYTDTKAMADRIPGARLVAVARGGHPLTHLDPRANEAIAEFLSSPARCG